MQLTVLQDHDGAWTLLLGQVGALAIEAHMRADRVESLVRLAESLPSRAPPVLLPHAALVWDQAELTFG